MTVLLLNQHVPVLAGEALRLARGRTAIVDGTAGGGGHTEAFLSTGARVMAVDRDPDAVSRLRARVGSRVTLLEGRFGDSVVLERISRFEPDLVFLDLGVSSQQLDEDERGFSFRRGVRLDMRMDVQGVTASELLNSYSLAQLRALFRDYADEPRAAHLAREIVRRRGEQPFATSDDLVNAVRAALGPRSGPGDFARLFQGVRIAVNDELNELETALPALRDALRPGGDVAVITYHSGEDRLVKHSFREWARNCVCDPKQPICTCRGQALGEVMTKKPIGPSDEELQANPRSRSAKLRVFRRAS